MMALQQTKQEIISLKLLKKGNQTLIFSHPKFIEIEKSIQIEEKNLILNAELKESVSEIDAVVISAGSIEASDKKRAHYSIDAN